MRRSSHFASAWLRVFLLFLCVWIASLTSGCVHWPARNVAYDPFVPNALLTRSEASVRSVAYRGATLDETTVTTRAEYKEVVIPERP
jgi:hypothetical protein